MASWTALANQPTFNASTMLLLTDGSVLVQAEGGKSWSKLTPDSSGSYINGTWSAIADMANTREYYASAVLSDGRVLVAGGEYSDAGGDTDKAEIYDPTTDTWTALGNPGWGEIGDASGCVLADGRLIIGNLGDPRTAIYSPASNSWAATGNMAARSNEETWTLLPDGTVHTVSCANHPQAEKYIPSSGTWVSAGSTPVELVQASSIEIGPAVLMTDGRVFCIGATGHTALYTPPAVPTDPGTWTTGPDFPTDSQGRLLKAKDAPASLLPSGNVLCTVGPAGDNANDWPQPAMFFEFDGTNLNRAPDPPNANNVIYAGRMLLVPTGQVLYAAGSQAIYVYTPDGTANSAWKPTITSCPTDIQLGGTYTISGQQFNGLSQAVSYGDDAQQATNYPLVRAQNVATGDLGYWRTANHSSMAVATGSAIVSTEFTVPASIPQGTYELTVVANGIASDPVTVTVDTGFGTAQYLIVDKALGDGNVLWAYAGGNWHGKSIPDADLTGITQDLFNADRVDAWWDTSGLTIVRAWDND